MSPIKKLKNLLKKNKVRKESLKQKGIEEPNNTSEEAKEMQINKQNNSLKSPKTKLIKKGDEITIPYTKVGKENYINVRYRIEVYDRRGKRKIGKSELISVNRLDSFVYQNYRYTIWLVSDEHITLKRVGKE